LVLGENESTPEEIVKKKNKKNQMLLVVSPEMIQHNLRYISQSDHANVFSQQPNKAKKI